MKRACTMPLPAHVSATACCAGSRRKRRHESSHRCTTRCRKQSHHGDQYNHSLNLIDQTHDSFLFRSCSISRLPATCRAMNATARICIDLLRRRMCVRSHQSAIFANSCCMSCFPDCQPYRRKCNPTFITLPRGGLTVFESCVSNVLQYSTWGESSQSEERGFGVAPPRPLPRPTPPRRIFDLPREGDVNCTISWRESGHEELPSLPHHQHFRQPTNIPKANEP